jgi:hypothetical protein
VLMQFPLEDGTNLYNIPVFIFGLDYCLYKTIWEVSHIRRKPKASDLQAEHSSATFCHRRLYPD